MNLLSLNGLSYSVTEKGVRKTLIHPTNLQLDLSLRTIVLGANGAGKSVLLRLIHGLLTPSAGTVSGPSPNERSMVLQKPVMLRRSVLANVRYAINAGRSKTDGAIDISALIRRTLDRVGLAARAADSAINLSGGEQQRLAIARAWVNEPSVLLLDEPTSHLDPTATAEIERIINFMHQDGVGIIMSTHNLAQAKRLADTIVFVHQARVLEVVPAAAFFSAPQSEAARAFLKSELLW